MPPRRGPQPDRQTGFGIHQPQFDSGDRILGIGDCSEIQELCSSCITSHSRVAHREDGQVEVTHGTTQQSRGLRLDYPYCKLGLSP